MNKTQQVRVWFSKEWTKGSGSSINQFVYSAQSPFGNWSSAVASHFQITMKAIDGKRPDILGFDLSPLDTNFIKLNLVNRNPNGDFYFEFGAISSTSDNHFKVKFFANLDIFSLSFETTEGNQREVDTLTCYGIILNETPN